MAQEHADNDMSGTFNGPAVQVGQVHGDVNIGAQTIGLDYLNAGAIHARLAKMSVHDCATTLAVLKPEKAADVLRLTRTARSVAVIASMDPESAKAIIVLLDEDRAAVLRAAVAAARTITTFAAQRNAMVGDASGDLVYQGRSERGAVGFSIACERATVYWSERTGLGMVKTAIKDLHTTLNGVRGRLGYPIGIERFEISSSSGFGRSQYFECTEDYGAEAIKAIGMPYGGAIYTSSKGTFATWGAIGEHYEASGGAGGPLGFPLSKETALRGKDENEVQGLYQEFEGGTLYWSELTAVGWVRPNIQSVYDKETWFRYGLPLGDQEIAAPSQQGTTGVFQRFQRVEGTKVLPGALIFSSEKYGAQSLIGPFRTLYLSSGTTAGPYGFPTDSFKKYGDGYFIQSFEGGMIALTLGKPPIGVVGKVYEVWHPNRTALGRPCAPERVIGDGPDVVQFFDNGIVTVTSGVAEMWLEPQSPTAL
ncbi:MAG TPA: hypothetical protein VL551_03050 [Actinospica sp.]|jgi:uncharacterized protein with LGFP repeats|nr:hypothetical protein [Actinospica sp.]